MPFFPRVSILHQINMKTPLRRTPKEMIEAVSIHQVDDSLLYSSPFRLPMLILLSLIFTWNAVLFIFTSANVHSIYYHNDLGPHGYFAGASSAASQTILFLFWATIPFLIWINSTVEIYERWRRTLGAERIVVTASCTLFFWVLAVGYWSPCVFSSYVIGNGKPLTKQPKYCPFPKGGPAWRIWHGDALMGVAPRAYYLTPWLVIPALFLYTCYLTTASVALHRKRNNRAERLLAICSKCRGPLTVQESQHKVAASFATEADTLSLLSPATLRASLPSYTESDFRRTSITYTQKDHEEYSQ